MPKLSHGTMLVTTVTHTLMVDTDTHMLITILERDPLMLNQKLKASHGMDMDTVDTVTEDIEDIMEDTVVITTDKQLNFNLLNYLEHSYFNLAIFNFSLVYLNFKMTATIKHLVNKRSFTEK